MQPNWVSEMDNESQQSKFVTFQDGTQTILEILSDPVKGVSKFTWQDGTPKTEFRTDVRKDGSIDVKTWAITSKDVMQQIISLVKMHALPSLIGCKLSIAVRGVGGSKKRDWFIQLVSKPAGAVPVAPAQNIPQAAPAQAPGFNQGAQTSTVMSPAQTPTAIPPVPGG